MKIIYIKKSDKFFTKGKIYDMIKLHTLTFYNVYEVLDDNNIVRYASESSFIKITQ